MAIAPGASRGGSFWLICDLLLSADQASFDTNTILGGNVPNAYKHLALSTLLRSDRAANATDGIVLQLNADTTAANYKSEALNFFATTVAAALLATDAGYNMGTVVAATAPANSFSQHLAEINNYNGTTALKMMTVRGMSYYGAGPNLQGDYQGGVWLSTAAITRLTLKPAIGSNWKAGSRFTLWGIA